VSQKFDIWFSFGFLSIRYDLMNLRRGASSSAMKLCRLPLLVKAVRPPSRARLSRRANSVLSPVLAASNSPHLTIRRFHLRVDARHGAAMDHADDDALGS
jgi:hypothetical protein